MKKLISLALAALTTIAFVTNAGALSMVAPYSHALYVTVSPSTTVAELEAKKTSAGDDVATGDIIIKDYGTYSASYTVVIKGDITGDGELNSSDYIKVRYGFLGLYEMSGVEAEAADVNDDSDINSTDFTQIRRHFLNTYDIHENKEITYTNEKWMSLIANNSEYASDLRTEVTYDRHKEWSEAWEQAEVEDVSIHAQKLKENNNIAMYVGTFMMDPQEGQFNYTENEEFIRRVAELFASLELEQLTDEEYKTYDNSKIYNTDKDGMDIYYDHIKADINFVGNEILTGFCIDLIENDPDTLQGTLVLSYMDNYYKITNLDEVGDELYEILAIIEVAF